MIHGIDGIVAWVLWDIFLVLDHLGGHENHLKALESTRGQVTGRPWRKNCL